MGKPPYDDPDALDLMRADADHVAQVIAPLAVAPDAPKAPIDGFDVPADAVALGELHFHLE